MLPSLLFFFFGLRLGLFSSVHSFVLGGQGGAQLSFSLCLLLVLGTALLTRGSAKQRRPLPALCILALVAPLTLFFVDDLLGQPLGSKWLKLLLWLPLAAPALWHNQPLYLSPLPTATLAWPSLLRLGKLSRAHTVLFASLAPCVLLSAGGISIVALRPVVDPLVSCGESFLSEWSLLAPSLLQSQSLCTHSLTSTYLSLLARPHLPYSRRLGMVDCVQQSILCLDHWLWTSIGHLSLTDLMLGLCPIFLALLLKKRTLSRAKDSASPSMLK